MKIVFAIYICLVCLLLLVSAILSLLSNKYEFNSDKERKLYGISECLQLTVLLMLAVGLCVVIVAIIVEA